MIIANLCSGKGCEVSSIGQVHSFLYLVQESTQ
jgi:hypothetical protein